MAKRRSRISSHRNSTPSLSGSLERWQLLLNVLRYGGGWREQWFRQLAEDSARFGWTIALIYAEVANDVEAVKIARNLEPGSLDNVAGAGRLAAHPDVRGEFVRLCAIVDEVWVLEKNLVYKTVRRRYHMLENLMRLQREPSDRCHAVSASAYKEYLQRQLPDKFADENASSKPPIEQSRSSPRMGATVAKTSEDINTGSMDLAAQDEPTDRMVLLQELRTIGSLIQQWIDHAVRLCLKSQRVGTSRGDR